MSILIHHSSESFEFDSLTASYDTMFSFTTVEAVPDGYQKDRRKITSWEEYQEETSTPNDQVPKKHLPIVHVRIHLLTCMRLCFFP